MMHLFVNVSVVLAEEEGLSASSAVEVYGVLKSGLGNMEGAEELGYGVCQAHLWMCYSPMLRETFHQCKGS